MDISWSSPFVFIAFSNLAKREMGFGKFKYVRILIFEKLRAWKFAKFFPYFGIWISPNQQIKAELSILISRGASTIP